MANRITFTMNEQGGIVRICADEDVEVFLICPHVPRDRVYQWSSLKVGKHHVDDEIDKWPVMNREIWPVTH